MFKSIFKSLVFNASLVVIVLISFLISFFAFYHFVINSVSFCLQAVQNVLADFHLDGFYVLLFWFHCLYPVSC